MLTVAYYLDMTLSETRYPADSAMIAPLGTKSIQQAWRDTLQKGDLVDALDKYGTWNTGTTIWTDTRDATDCKMPMLRVGFRQYGPEGDKSDGMGTFSGFTE